VRFESTWRGVTPDVKISNVFESQADAEKQREERGEAEKRCEQLDSQNSQLRADLELAVEEGIKYRESLREWAMLEERRLAQGTPVLLSCKSLPMSPSLQSTTTHPYTSCFAPRPPREAHLARMHFLRSDLARIHT
jgi:hypothetical protein